MEISLHIASILLPGTEFRVVFSSTEGFGTEFRDFLFRGTTGIPSEITICSVYSVFRGIIFLSEIPNPTYNDALGENEKGDENDNGNEKGDDKDEDNGDNSVENNER